LNVLGVITAAAAGPLASSDAAVPRMATNPGRLAMPVLI
jgi:hypothetical protein